jgi:hypothetical protein
MVMACWLKGPSDIIKGSANCSTKDYPGFIKKARDFSARCSSWAPNRKAGYPTRGFETVQINCKMGAIEKGEVGNFEPNLP